MEKDLMSSLSDINSDLGSSVNEYKEINNFNIDNSECFVCGRFSDEENCLLCDFKDSNSLRCYNSCHLYCMTPALSNVPDYDWFCPSLVKYIIYFTFLHFLIYTCTRV